MRVHAFALASGKLCSLLFMTLSSRPIPRLRQLSIPEEPEDGLSPRRRKFIGLNGSTRFPWFTCFKSFRYQPHCDALQRFGV